MLTHRIIAEIPKILRRNFGIAAPVLQKATDPIQQLFIEKIREYKTKSSKDAIPEIEKERKQELERVAKQFGGGTGVDLTSFPTFKFEEPVIDNQLKSKE